MADTKSADQSKDFLVFRGNYYEYNLPPVKRRISSGKWGTPTRSIEGNNNKPASKQEK